MKEPIKIILDPEELPKQWYNMLADVPAPFPPYLHPQTQEPITDPEFLMALFPNECVKQEVSQDRYIDIPEDLREAYYRIGRPSPLHRAKRLEAALNTPAKIFLKREDLSPPGSHKPNTAIAQAYFAKKEGVERLTTETGAGQWGSALAYSCALMGLGCKVFMVRISYQQKPYRKYLMSMYGATVYPSPSEETEFGKTLVQKDKNHPGSLGIAISEAVEAAMKDDKAKYTLGSVLNHVILHQTIVGQELIKLFEKIDLIPDILVGCVGGGSNFSGFAFPFIGKQLRGELDKDLKVITVEASACPHITEGEYRYDYGDTAKTAPLAKMYTLGHDFVPPPIHSGGLRYHGMSPMVSLLVKEGLLEPRAYPQEKVFASARLLAETEGLVTAPETAHALHAVIIEAKKCKETGESNVICYNHSGHGMFDLEGYKEVLKLPI